MKLIHKKNISKRENWDIEIENTHCFYANGILVHNSNLSLWYNGTDFRIAKRSGFIGKESGFFAVWVKWESLKEKMEDLYTSLWRSNGVLKELVVYGEWFGGYFPGHKNKNAARVQKGIAYTPDNEFYAFDMVIDGQLVPKELFVEYCRDKFFIAESIFEGTLDECLKYPNSFPSTIPERLGYKYPETDNDKNICEGIVIKSVVPMYIGESRMIFKSKNEKFAEINGSKHEKRTPKEIPPGFIELMNEIEEYITDNRLSNVLSKEGISDDDLSPKHIGMLIGLVFEDAMDDYSKDTGFDLLGLDNETRKLVHKHLSHKIVTLVKERMKWIK